MGNKLFFPKKSQPPRISNGPSLKHIVIALCLRLCHITSLSLKLQRNCKMNQMDILEFSRYQMSNDCFKHCIQNCIAPLKLTVNIVTEFKSCVTFMFKQHAYLMNGLNKRAITALYW